MNMDQQHIGRTLSLCAPVLVTLALAGCDNGSSGVGTGASSSAGPGSTTSGTPGSTTSGTPGSTTSGTPGSTTGTSTGSPTSTSSGSTTGAVMCTGGYCTSPIGMGGYAFSYADSQNPPPQAEGTSTATLAADGSLCISGSVGLVGMMAGMPDYTDDWGCGLGINLNQAMAPAGAPIDALQLTGSTITVSTNGVPSCTTARIVLDQNGTSAVCAPLTDGVAIDYTSFNTTCWNEMGTSLTAAPNSQALKIQFVTSGSATTPCDFTNFCITGITITP